MHGRTRKMTGGQGAEKEEDGVQVSTQQELGRWWECRVLKKRRMASR
jgi:hypothetical protein